MGSLDYATRAGSTQSNQGQEWADWQEGQNQLMAIQAQQQQDLLLQQQADAYTTQQNQLLGTAGMIVGGGSSMGNFNASTQSTMGRYGLQQPRVQRSSTMQNRGSNQITVNNTTVYQGGGDYGGPVAGRGININEDTTRGRFQTWLTSVFQKQDQESRRQRLEYERRESSLTRSANKLMRKLEGVGQTIGERLDPSRIGTTLTSQLRSLFLIFGFGMLAANWGKLLEGMNSLTNFFTKDETGKNGFQRKLIEIFGGDPNGSENVWDAFRKIFYTFDNEEFVSASGARWNQGIINLLLEGINLKLEAFAESLVKTASSNGGWVGTLMSILGNSILSAVNGAARGIGDNLTQNDAAEYSTDEEEGKRILAKNTGKLGERDTGKENPRDFEPGGLVESGGHKHKKLVGDNGIFNVAAGENGDVASGYSARGWYLTRNGNELRENPGATLWASEVVSTIIDYYKKRSQRKVKKAYTKQHIITVAHLCRELYNKAGKMSRAPVYKGFIEACGGSLDGKQHGSYVIKDYKYNDDTELPDNIKEIYEDSKPSGENLSVIVPILEKKSGNQRGKSVELYELTQNEILELLRNLTGQNNLDGNMINKDDTFFTLIGQALEKIIKGRWSNDEDFKKEIEELTAEYDLQDVEATNAQNLYKEAWEHSNVANAFGGQKPSWRDDRINWSEDYMENGTKRHSDSGNTEKILNLGDESAGKAGYVRNVTKAFGGTGQLNSNYGEWRPANGATRAHWHQGVDLQADEGSEVYFPSDGIVEKVTGDSVRIRVGATNYATIFRHIKPIVHEGDHLTTNSVVGTTNDLNHIHMEVVDGNNNDKHLNPLTFWRQRGVLGNTAGSGGLFGQISDIFKSMADFASNVISSLPFDKVKNMIEFKESSMSTEGLRRPSDINPPTSGTTKEIEKAVDKSGATQLKPVKPKASSIPAEYKNASTNVFGGKDYEENIQNLMKSNEEVVQDDLKDIRASLNSLKIAIESIVSSSAATADHTSPRNNQAPVQNNSHQPTKTANPRTQGNG